MPPALEWHASTPKISESVTCLRILSLVSWASFIAVLINLQIDLNNIHVWRLPTASKLSCLLTRTLMRRLHGVQRESAYAVERSEIPMPCVIYVLFPLQIVCVFLHAVLEGRHA